MNKLLMLLIVSVSVVGALGQKAGVATDEDENILAILPLRVITEDRKAKRNEDILAKFREQDRRDGIIMQRDLYRYFLRDLYKRSYPSDYIQDVNETNRRLEEAGIPQNEVFKTRPEELARILKVDGVISGEIDHRVPTKGFLVNITSGGWPGSNQIKTIFRLHSVRGKLVWGREIKMSGADKDGQIYGVCKKVLRKIPELFPYHRMDRESGKK